MTQLYPNVARHSMLVPYQWEPEWTFTDHVMCDQLPGAPGSGAVELAARSLNLSLADAANYVAANSEAKNLNAGALLRAAANQKSFGWAAGSAAAAAGMRGAYAGRLPIAPSVATQVALLGGDAARVSLLIQNNCAAGNATLLVSIDGAIDTSTPWAYMQLPPGQGIFMSQNAWTNPIYVAWGSGTVDGGVLFYGTNTGQDAGTRPQSATNNAGGGAWYSPPYSSY